MILAHLGGGGGGGGPSAAGAGGPPPHTAGVAFPEMPSAAAAGHGGAAAYYESYERHGMPPNTAPPGTALSHHSAMGDPTMMQAGSGPQGRINYVVPSAAETAAIAAQARLKRQRGNTLP